ncbi:MULTISPECIES: substrate-binding periplasmic protein [Deefgea]|uniref:Transporter substrate-binding domain-containing protein n=1 Tax=Deefgea chitinilytica TaxID=570276 RepID=A0ABS2CEQ8_9NEIS|nr:MULTISPECIES: transporter substrate-binding domain-containing protein [Deefgea]MBM5571943.1 transporter substrate-binding domain-containing protein [Deefgea chitinilytica]MBM9889178.1 transporter substrate-binding domain-containing protein [Deefgea sp. CFH1-16]
MTKLCALIIAIFSLCSPLIEAVEKVTLYGDDSNPPYMYFDGQTYKGIYVDLVNLAAKRLAPEYQVEIQGLPWKRALDYTKSGRGIGIVSTYLQKKRPYISPYSVPMYRETIVIFCNPKTQKSNKVKFPDDFKDLRIGVNLGYLLSPNVQAAVQSGAIKVEEAKGNSTNLLKLAASHIDCYANDRLAAQYTLQQLKKANPSMANFKLFEASALSHEDAFIGYSQAFNAPYKADFIRKMNASLEQAIKSGELDQIIARYVTK